MRTRQPFCMYGQQQASSVIQPGVSLPEGYVGYDPHANSFWYANVVDHSVIASHVDCHSGTSDVYSLMAEGAYSRVHVSEIRQPLVIQSDVAELRATGMSIDEFFATDKDVAQIRKYVVRAAMEEDELLNDRKI